MTEQIFNFQVPEQAYGHPDALSVWIMSHLSPGIPVAKTTIEATSYGDIYTSFISKMERLRSKIAIDAYRITYGQPLISDAEYLAWVSSRTIEIKILRISDGRFQGTFQLCGTPHTSLNNSQNSYSQDITNFELGMYYNKEKDEYNIIFKDPGKAETAFVEMTEVIKPIKLFPVFEYNYKAEVVKGSKNNENCFTTSELLSDFSTKFFDNFWNKPKEKDATIKFSGMEAITKQLKTLKVQLETADELAGGFFRPLLLNAFTVEIPFIGGKLFYTRIMFSYGQRVTIMLPCLICHDSLDNIVVLSLK